MGDKLKKLNLLAVIVIILSGCGGGGGGAGNTNETPTVLEGIWVKACDVSSLAGTYDIVTMTFTGNTFVSKGESFTDIDCMVVNTANPSATLSGTFIIGSELTTTGGLQANEFNIHSDTFNDASYDDHSYTIFNITGDILYAGDDSGVKDASTEALRPDTLDLDRIFNRQ